MNKKREKSEQDKIRKENQQEKKILRRDGKGARQ